MAADGTITLQLTARGNRGEIGHGALVYPTDHDQYQEVLRHVGGMTPGETKSVPPWPTPKG